MNKKGIAGVLLLMLIALFSLSAQAEWKTTDKGTIYTTTQSPGYLRGWQTIDGSKYYFKSDGIMVTGKIKINHVYYYFKKNGKLRTETENITSISENLNQYSDEINSDLSQYTV